MTSWWYQASVLWNTQSEMHAQKMSTWLSNLNCLYLHQFKSKFQNSRCIFYPEVCTLSQPPSIWSDIQYMPRYNIIFQNLRNMWTFFEPLYVCVMSQQFATTSSARCDTTWVHPIRSLFPVLYLTCVTNFSVARKGSICSRLLLL